MSFKDMNFQRKLDEKFVNYLFASLADNSNTVDMLKDIENDIRSISNENPDYIFSRCTALDLSNVGIILDINMIPPLPQLHALGLIKQNYKYIHMFLTGCDLDPDFYQRPNDWFPPLELVSLCASNIVSIKLDTKLLKPILKTDELFMQLNRLILEKFFDENIASAEVKYTNKNDVIDFSCYSFLDCASILKLKEEFLGAAFKSLSDILMYQKYSPAELMQMAMLAEHVDIYIDDQNRVTVRFTTSNQLTLPVVTDLTVELEDGEYHYFYLT